MQAIKKWTRDKPFLIALLAPQLAVTARDIHLAFQHTKQRRIMSHQFPLPHLPAWFALYRSHRKPINFLRKIFSGFSKFGGASLQFGEEMLAGFQELGRGKQTETFVFSPEELQETVATMQTVLDESFQEIKEDISPQPVDPSEKAAMLSLFTENNNLESSFFILVTVPCWLIYRISPTRLYRKARQGNFDALEKLLMLDPLMLHDPTIGKKIQELRFTHKNSKYEKLLQAPLKEHQLKVTSQQMKYAIGGLLSALAKVINKKLTAPDIQKLFDAVAQDFDQKLNDLDFLTTPNGFARSIFRYRDEWLNVFKSDTKK